MEEVSLNEPEARFYSELFQCCDVEKTGKIAMLKAMELYRSANIPNDVILQITSVANIPATALHISRAQFYSCLKLIAAYQTQMPLREEIIAATLNLPLPKFNWKDMPNDIQMNHNQANGINPIPPPPPADRRNSLQRRGSDWIDGTSNGSRRNSSQQQVQQETSINSDVHSTDSEIEQNESSCGGDIGGSSCGASGLGNSSRDIHHRRGGSPEAWSTNSDSPTPTNSVAERPWAKEAIWQGLLGDEHRQLLGTEEESSDRHSSDEDNEPDLETIYQITPEQREYYYKQFKAVQHDNNGLLSGQVARVFFEKSRIPVEELRHIWQLCDVTRDGALSLAEFTAAMHLVVLRRNNIPLPTVLPDCLHPSVLQQIIQKVPQEPPEADLLHLNDDDDEEETTDHTLFNANTTVVGSSTNNSRTANEKNVMNISTISTSSQASTSSRQGINTSSLSPPPIPPPVKNRSKPNSPISETDPVPSQVMSKSMSTVTNSSDVNKMSKDRALWTTDVPPTQWTKFTESPTSNVSSPGPKPVNFDMQRTAQAVVSDPQILHPVALRVTPVGSNSSAVATSSNIPNTVSTNNSNNNNNETIAHQNDAYEANLLNRDNSPKQQIQSIANNVTHPIPIAPTTQQIQQSQSIPAANNQQTQQQPPQTSTHRDSLQNSDLRAIQRPQAKKLPSKNIGAIPPPPQREPSVGSSANNTLPSNNSTTAGANPDVDFPHSIHSLVQNSNKKEPPPLPPPRPHRHGRSSSLDLNKFKINTPSGQQAEITTQASFDLQTSTGFADFSNFPADSTTNVINDQLKLDEQQQHSLPAPISKPLTTGGVLSGVQGTGSGTSTVVTGTIISQHPSTQPVSMPPTRISLQSNQRVSAFEVYRKPNTPRNSMSPPPPPLNQNLNQSQQQQQPQPPQQQQQLQQLQQQSQQQIVQSITTNTNNNVGNDVLHFPQPTQPPPPAPFGALGAIAITANTIIPSTIPAAVAASSSSSSSSSSTTTTTITTTTLPNADLYEKRVNAISESLKHVSFKQEHGNMPDILRHLREQNTLLLRLCNDLSDELLIVQTRKEDIRLKLEFLNADNISASTVTAPTGTISSSIGNTLVAPNLVRTGSSISAPVTANVTGGSGSSGGGYSNV